MLGDLKIYETGNEEVDLATKELADQFNEYKEEGYSELRVLEELGLTDELDDVTRQYLEQADVKRLEEARASGDEEAYMRLLGGMSTAVGELADQRTYEIAAGILTDEETRDILRERSRYQTITQEIFDNVKYKNYDPTVNRDDYNQYETAKEQVLSQDKDPVITIEGDTRPPQTDVEAPPLDDDEVDVATGDDDPDNTVDPDVDFTPVTPPEEDDEEEGGGGGGAEEAEEEEKAEEEAEETKEPVENVVRESYEKWREYAKEEAKKKEEADAKAKAKAEAERKRVKGYEDLNATGKRIYDLAEKMGEPLTVEEILGTYFYPDSYYDDFRAGRPIGNRINNFYRKYGAWQKNQPSEVSEKWIYLGDRL